jgi:dTDP-4-dehydrorhamnose reductase
VVTDEFVSPTNTAQIARQISDLLQTEAYDVYHVTANGQCSWYEFARLIFDELNLQTPLEPTTSTLFAAPVRRPLYSVLENGNLKKTGNGQHGPLARHSHSTST